MRRKPSFCHDHTLVKFPYKLELSYGNLSKVYRIPVNFKLFLKVKENLTLPFDLVSGVVQKYTCGRFNSTYYGEMGKHLKVGSWEHKPSKESTIRDHYLSCNNTPSFEKFITLTNGNNKFALKIKESLLFKWDRSISNKNISSAKLALTIIGFLIISLYRNIV